ncbi:efflux RND transporter periplasmic adaptor subunit [Nitrosomonas mobilis]|uniref:Efflux transporter, RND family, MFP subunit n=1 Tax=Nitrosomonas mobilis TaxID=51642 RepID=A0A1G5SCB0_9PROT|nr:efflux RND transporter periplasmic adaptor subunit [Nitrosomonas mobilis]SCZ84823.1 Efflux transporter, RND family, MFP subunit [Nitrosomonas mobilis]HNO75638.1 efflux RND transporter periplasmic adaptor subunit [Nitrosomonas mobilis]
MSKALIITAIVMLIVGISGGWFAGHYLQPDILPPQQDAGQTTNSEKKAKEPLFYRNPMNPSATSPVPAKDSMGMDYVPVYADDAETGSPTATVKIDAVTVQNIGVRTAIVKKDILSHIVRALGRVDYDEERIVRLHPKVEGWIETMRVDKTGEKVKFNQDLLSIYSPQLVVSQQEYILALNNLENLEKSPIEDIRRGAEELVSSSRKRLRFLDVPKHQLHDLTHDHNIHKTLHIHSPASGIVVNIGAREGQYVTPKTEIYMIADLSKIWVYADIYENELPWVKQGDLAEMQLAGIPGRIFRGHLAFIYPYAEAKTRTIKVRLEFDNTELLLKPEMFAEVSIYASKQMSALIIPSEAVIRSGTRDKVLVVRSAGKFEPRTITTGIASGGKVIVLEGLKEGEEVVTSAQFLIDSESSLREATAKMSSPGLQESKPNPLQIEEGPHQHD